MTGQEPLRKVRRRAGGEPNLNGEKVDNSVSTLKKLFQLYSNADLCDVQLQVGTNVFHAHKLILSMSSDVFKTMLTDMKWPDARKARIVLNEEPECEQVFSEFVQYMYTGSIHLSNLSVLPVLTLADKYNIYDLSKVCKQYMLTHCHACPASLKVVSWLQYAFLYGDHELEAKLKQYIELNFDHVMQSDDFLTVQQHMLEKVLNSKHLIIHSEFTLFQGLKKWLLHNLEISQANRMSCGIFERKLVCQLMSHVRLPLMKCSQLLMLASDPLVCEHSNFFLPKLVAAWTFRSQSLSAVSLHNMSLAIRQDENCSSINPGTVRTNGSSFGASSSPCDSKIPSSFQAGSAVDPDASADRLALFHSSRRIYFATHILGNCINNACSSSSGCFHPALSPHCDFQGSMLEGSSKEGDTCYAPRNYTCEDWSTCLAIEDFASFPQYSSHTYFFSTPAGPLPVSLLSSSERQAGAGDFFHCVEEEEGEDSAGLEWQVELYPKGVRFPHAVMIGIPNNYDIDEHCQDVVRLAVMSKTQHQQPCRVGISVLAVAAGAEDGSEYIEALAHRTCIFDKDRTLHNIDDIVSYRDLNRAGTKYLTASKAGGPDRTCFKVLVIIKPS